MKRIGTIGLCMAFCLTMHAQKTYTLEECRAMAIENNLKLKNAQNDIEAALQGKKEALTAYFPNVSATGMAFNANTGTIQAEMGPGMELSLLKNGALGGVTAVQPVFAGGQIVHANRLSKKALEVSRIQKELTENEVNLATEEYFWQMVNLKEKKKTIASLAKMLEKLHKDVEVAVEAGVTTRNDLLQVQLKKNEVESNRIHIENGISLCRMVLAQHIGLDTPDFDIEAVEGDALPASPDALFCDHHAMLGLTPEYRLLEKNVEVNHLQHKLAIGKNLPNVGIGVGYMYTHMMDKDHSFGVAFASVSVPISGWWGGSHAIKKQKLKTINARNDLENQSKLLLIRMQQVWNDLQNAYRQTQIAWESIDQSAENLRLHNDYYQAGTSTMSELLDAQSLYQQSRDKYVDACSQYHIKTLEYKQATGTH